METLRNLSEISITVAGFSALITLFQNKDGNWGSNEKNNLNRLYIMVEMSLLNCSSCYLPILFSGYISEAVSYRISSAIITVLLLVYFLYVINRNKRLTGTSNPGGKGTIMIKAVSSVTIAFCFINALGVLKADVGSNYTVIMFLMLTTNFYFFLRIIYSSIRIPSQDNNDWIKQVHRLILIRMLLNL